MSHDHNHSHEHGAGCACHSDGCACGHESSEGGGWNKTLLLRLGAAVLLTAISFLPFFSPTLRNLLQVLAFAVAGFEVIYGALKEMFTGQVFNENLLMSIASVGAICIGEYFEAAAVMILFNIGELLSERAVWNSKNSIVSLLDLRPETVLKKSGGDFVPAAPETVTVGDVLRVRPGDKVGLDGVVTEGTSYIDTSALTGESVPTAVAPGSKLLSGSINKSGLLEMRVTAEYGESTASKIIELVRDTASQKSKSEQFITKFSRYYTPSVVGLAVLVALLSPVLLGVTYSESVYNALNFLIISCPCALVISVPLAYFMGIAAAARQGLLVKGGNFLEALNHIEAIAFDKTGTLTEGRFSVTRYACAEGVSREELLELAALAEIGSTHPIAEAILGEYGAKPDTAAVQSVEEIAGGGIVARTVRGEIRVGTPRFLRDAGVTFMPSSEAGTAVCVARDGSYQGTLFLADKPKKTAADTIAALKKLGIGRILMLTGDNGQNAVRVADKLGITEVRGGLLPGEKLDVMRELIARRSASGKVVFVGDGINDAPALAIADVGMAMGALGSNAAIEAADVVLMHDEIGAISDGIRTAAFTRKIVIENIVLALGIKAAIMLLSVLGDMNILISVIADVGVSLLAVANTLRLYRIGKRK